ncbi:hypothetical protein BANRA_04469 [Escherichia coli]|nr:hypothetical protein BANRA_04469 [Escherichia coli]
MATTNAFSLASPPLARICLHGDLQRFGRRLSLYVNTAAEAIRALSMQMPGFRRQMNEGWPDTYCRMTRHRRRCTPVFTNSWVRERSSTLCRDWPGPERVDCRLCWGRQPSWALSSLPGHQWRYGVQPWQPVVFLPPRCCFHLEPA